ncbi:hypothetical protein JCM8097_002304 [Rhodosporidiobolus ruineniae]
MTNLVTITLPDVPEGENPFEFWRWAIRGLLNPTPTPGFAARLGVLWALMGYGLVVAFVYLAVMFVEYRRRGRKFWLWRIVTRPNGRFVVGNQHALFAICSIVSCGVLLGYGINTRRVVLLLKYQQRAFFWRSLVWVPMILHAWISSFSNLQAAILSSQKATNKHLLSPVVANTLYIAGIIIVLLPIIVLDAYSGFSWRRTWSRALTLKASLISHAATYDPSRTSIEQAVADIAAPLDSLNHELDFFGKTQRAVAGLYVLAMLVIIAANIGGLGLLFTLRKQIKFNTRRLSGQMRSGTFSTTQPSAPVLPTPPASAHNPNRNSYFPGSDSPPHPLSPDPEVVNAPPTAEPPKTLIRKVFFASSAAMEGKEAEMESTDKMTVSQLKQAASNKTMSGAAQREQAKQILALKKIGYDLFVFLAAIVCLATIFLAIALWLCIKPSSVFSSWPKMETAFFLLPWAYLVSVDASLSFLLYNSVNHLLSHKSRLRGRATSVVGLGVRGGEGAAGPGGSISGLTFTDDELTSDTGTMSRPAPTLYPPPRMGGVGVTVERHVTVEMDEPDEALEESPRGSRVV